MISPRTNIPPPLSELFKQWENTFGATPREDNCEITERSCCPNPKIPSTALSGLVNSPVWVLLHLFQKPTKISMSPTPKVQERQQKWKASPESKLLRSSPKNNTSGRIHSWIIPNNCVKRQRIRHIISWCPTPVTIFKFIIALRIWRLRRAACLSCLSSRSAYFIRTSNPRSCWRSLQTEGVEPDLYR